MIRNSTTAWGWPAIVLHWLGAALIIVLLAHGWWMTHMTPRPERLANYNLHAAIGYDFLTLLILRLLWRWLNPVPALEGAAWERYAARAGHILLYVLMFACSLTGWLLAGTFRNPLDHDLLGLALPLLANSERAAHRLYEEAHMILAYALAVLVVVHVLGALRHHVIKHNDVLRRMLVGAKP